MIPFIVESVRILKELRSDVKPPSSRTTDDLTRENIPMTQPPENFETTTFPSEEITEVTTSRETSTEQPSVTKLPTGNSPKGTSTIKDSMFFYFVKKRRLSFPHYNNIRVFHHNKYLQVIQNIG